SRGAPARRGLGFRAAPAAAVPRSDSLDLPRGGRPDGPAPDVAGEPRLQPGSATEGLEPQAPGPPRDAQDPEAARGRGPRGGRGPARLDDTAVGSGEAAGPHQAAP